MDLCLFLRYAYSMKKVPAKPWMIGLLQATGVAGTIVLALSFLFLQFYRIEPDPVTILLVFCSFAMVDLLIVLAYPLQLIAAGKYKEAFLILRWSFVWLVAGTLLWIVFLRHFFLPAFGVFD